MRTCPGCDGSGYAVEVYSSEAEQVQDTRKCDVCDGSGTCVDYAIGFAHGLEAAAKLVEKMQSQDGWICCPPNCDLFAAAIRALGRGE